MDQPYSISDFAFSLGRREGITPESNREERQVPTPRRSHGQDQIAKNSPIRSRPTRLDRSRTIYRGRTANTLVRFRGTNTHRSGQVSRRANRRSGAVRISRRSARRWKPTLETCAKHGLVEQRTIEGHSSYSTKVLTLTKEGQWLLKRAQLVSNQQATYHGLAKPKEARHDAELYRLYQKVAKRSNDSGGKVRRVILDLELKKELYQAISRMRPEKDPAMSESPSPASLI